MSVQLSLTTEPVAVKDYVDYSPNALPRVVLGFKIKNKFDESRTIIKSKYRPKRILHFRWTSQLEPVFLHGVELTCKPRFASLLTSLKSNRIIWESDTYNDCLSNYRATLSDYGLSCDDCFSYFSDGMYPVDVKHLNNISHKSFANEIETGLGNMLQKTKHPWYCTLPNFKIFIITWSSGYSFDYSLKQLNNNEK